jgi:hypothetical protein
MAARMAGVGRVTVSLRRSMKRSGMRISFHIVLAKKRLLAVFY